SRKLTALHRFYPFDRRQALLLRGTRGLVEVLLSGHLHPRPDRVRGIDAPLGLNQRVQEVVRNTVTFNVAVDFGGMVTVITQRVENLSQGKMWQVSGDLFWRNSLSPKLDYGPDRRSGALDYGLAAQDVIVSDDIEMFRFGCHEPRLSQVVSLRYPTPICRLIP